MFCDYNINNNFFVKQSKFDQIKQYNIKFRLKKNEKSKNVNFFHSNIKTKKTKKNNNINKNNNVAYNKKKFTQIIQKKIY